MLAYICGSLSAFVCLLVRDGMVAAGASGLTEVGGRIVFGTPKSGRESELDIEVRGDCVRLRRILQRGPPTKAPEVHAATTDLPFGGQQSDFVDRKCSKSFFRNVLPTTARSTFFENM